MWQKYPSLTQTHTFTQEKMIYSIYARQRFDQPKEREIEKKTQFKQKNHIGRKKFSKSKEKIA